MIGHAAIAGAGGMGTALAVLLARHVPRVTLWARGPEQARAIQAARENTRHLPGVPLPDNVGATHDAALLRDATLVVIAVPCVHLRATLPAFAQGVGPGVPLLSVIKGIERETFARPSTILAEQLPGRPVLVLSGPSHAEEFARGLPASVVIAGGDPDLARDVSEVIRSETFRVYLNVDVDGVELAGALKNILGVAAGICEGLGFGDNAKAALLTRGLVEMARLATRLGAAASTFWGLAGVGDVLTTCYSPYGRNRAVGIQVGRGVPLGQVLAGMHDVAEGVYTTQSVHALADRLGIDMPITREVHAILFEGKPPRAAVTDLMVRELKFE
jgi:glycerol-3-phosphate dehydrogenase (NAD(P)+)